MAKQIRLMSAMAVIDLARELYQRHIIDQTDIEALDGALFTNVQALINNHDMSSLIEERYPEHWITQLWGMAHERALGRPVGLEIGRTITHKASGIINHFMQHCTHLEEVLEVYLKYSSLVNPADTWRMEKVADQVRLSFCFVSDLTYPQCAVERSMVFLYHWACHYTEQSLPLLQVEFCFESPSYAQALQDQFQCPIKYDQSKNQLILSESILATKLKHDQPYLKNILKQRVNRVLDATGSVPSIGDKVCHLLKQDLSRYSSQPMMANELCMSRATLSRKLKREGTSFSQLLSQARRQFIEENPQLPIKQMVYQLGFSDESAYYKAKKKWQK